FSSRRRHTRSTRDWSSDVCSSDLKLPAPQPAMERQIQNAVDAGDGDYEIRLLRQKMALEPDNLEVRLALAKRYESVGSPELALEIGRASCRERGGGTGGG